MTYDVDRIRAQFPILDQEANGRPLVYLDNAATTQKPQAVIDALTTYYSRDNANVHRGVHVLASRATKAYEDARSTVQRFVNAADASEIVFTRGTTEAINLVANAWGRDAVGAGDNVVVTHMEHHSDIVPWQMLCDAAGAELRVAPVTDTGELDLDGLATRVDRRTRLVGCVYVSNALGTINPVEQVTEIAHEHGAMVLLDAAQASAHVPIDVQRIGCDFLAMSGHKVYAPTGIGALYGRAAILREIRPWQGGGEMILKVSFEGTTYNEIPHKFEAGTPNIGGAVAFAAALNWLTELGIEAAARHEESLRAYGTERLQEIDGLRIVGTASRKVGVLSFVIDGIHPHDIGTIVDGEGVAIRTGHHCTQPLMRRFGVPATSRASIAAYNTRDDIDRLVDALGVCKEMFA